MPPADPAADGVRHVERSLSDRWLGGVAGGLAQHFGVATWIIRLVFVVTTLSGGLGLVAYVLMWMLFPLSTSAQGVLARRADGSWDLAAVLGTLALALGVLVGLALIGLPIRVSAWGPLLVVGAGAVLVWRQGDDLRGASVRSPSSGGVPAAAALADRQGWVRVLVGLALVAVGLIAVIGPRLDLVTTGWALAAVAAVVAGMGLIALPWISSWLRGLEAQRYGAARAQERAAMAAQVHDSVLQTLTLIQRRADDPAEVARLARAEERALRSWLYAPVGPAGSLGAALAAVVASTETDYDARIELVTVGDAALDPRLDALVAGTREAVVNAAKHAHAPVTVYAEVDDEQVEINVRDRGVGFEPADVPADRHGISASIRARMTAVHGSAVVRSAPGAGTEVRLILPRAAEVPDPRRAGRARPMASVG
ncbi:MAG: PspC domain-containing protein, partial [Candidatus Nanopelagicales bacterium]